MAQVQVMEVVDHRLSLVILEPLSLVILEPLKLDILEPPKLDILVLHHLLGILVLLLNQVMGTGMVLTLR